MENNQQERQELSLSVIVEPGKVTGNFEQFKAMIRKELDEKYSTIEVSEERLKDARAARARLNAAKESLKKAMRSAQLQNDEPLVVPRQQAQELDDLLSEYIERLDTQIKDIEEAQRAERMRKASETFIQILATYPPEVQEIAVQCKWITNPKWSNSTYSALQVRKDCTTALDGVADALQAFEGEFRAQMIADYIKNGNLAGAMLFGANLRKQKEAYEARLKAREEQRASEPVPERKEAQEPVPCAQPETPARRAVAMTEVVAPSEFLKDANSQKKAYIDIRITAARYQIAWVLNILRGYGLTFTRLDNVKEE